MAFPTGNIGNNLVQDLEKQRKRQEREMMLRSKQSQINPQQTALNTAMQSQQKAMDVGIQQKQAALPTNLQPGQTVQLKTQPVAASPESALQAEQLRNQLQEVGAMQSYLQQPTPTPAQSLAIMQQEQQRYNQQMDTTAQQLALRQAQEQDMRQQEQYTLQQQMQQAMTAENQRHQQAIANIQNQMRR